jgi:hypothetical protein
VAVPIPHGAREAPRNPSGYDNAPVSRDPPRAHEGDGHVGPGPVLAGYDTPALDLEAIEMTYVDYLARCELEELIASGQLPGLG